MPLLWLMIKDEDCVKLIKYQHEHHSGCPLQPPGESPILISTDVKIETLDEIAHLMQQRPKPKGKQK